MHSRDVIARVKALMLCGVSAKVAAALSNISLHTVMSWRTGERCGNIQPDLSIKERLVVLIKGGHAAPPLHVRSPVAAGEVRPQETQQAPAVSEAKPDDTRSAGSL